MSFREVSKSMKQEQNREPSEAEMKASGSTSLSDILAKQQACLDRLEILLRRLSARLGVSPEPEPEPEPMQQTEKK
jgi:uncharacterized coiled-coil protein SlyX